MTQPSLPPTTLRDVTGPYDQDNNGACHAGHPLNASGRCEPQNVAEFPTAEAAKTALEKALGGAP